MGLRTYIITCLVAVIITFTASEFSYRQGWKEGRANLVSQQEEKARSALAKRVAAQQVIDKKAVEADQAGAAKTVVITKEVVKYVQNPDRVRCIYDDSRVSIKQRAVDNANAIPGYDGEAVPVSGSGKGQ